MAPWNWRFYGVVSLFDLKMGRCRSTRRQIRDSADPRITIRVIDHCYHMAIIA